MAVSESKLNNRTVELAGPDTTATALRVPFTAWLERRAPLLLVVSVVLWVAVVFAGSYFKYETFGQGYDQIDYEQAIWNTVQGRPMEDSRFSFTDSVFGMDWMPMLMLFVPFYALIPSAHTLFFLQILGSALGALPLYWLARDKLGSKIAGLCIGLVYLLYPTLLHGVLNPFQVRLFAVSLLLFAFYYHEKANWKLWTACALLALIARSDVGLVVGMFGVYNLLTRRNWQWVVPPLALGFGYFAVSTFVILPSFIHPDALKGPSGPITDYMACWPCGHNPMLAYYGHLGGTLPDIVKHIVTQPVATAQLMFSGVKLEYMISLLVPLAFLSLLAPKPLVLGLPILVLNLLSLRTSQFNYQFHYSLLLMPCLFAGAIYGAHNLLKFIERRRKGEAAIRIGSRMLPIQTTLMLGLVAWSLLMNIPYKNPIVRTVLFHTPAAQVTAARELVALVPPDAKVAASSKLAPHLLPRRYIYNFPPAPYSPYNFGPDRQSERFVDLDYILVDPDNSALEVNPVGGQSALALLKSLPDWSLEASKENLYLYKRVH